MREKIKITLYMTIIILATSYIMSNEVLAQTVEKTELEKAKEHFVNGEYKQAIIIYEQLLENNPNSVSLLKMKAVALSNLGDDLNSLKEFYKIIHGNSNVEQAYTLYKKLAAKDKSKKQTKNKSKKPNNPNQNKSKKPNNPNQNKSKKPNNPNQNKSKKPNNPNQNKK